MANGKVCTGFSKPYVAIYNANGGSISYTSGRVLARGVEVSIEPETSDDNNFYADNQTAESANGTFTGGTLNLTVDGLFTDAERLIMGLPSAGADGFMAYGDNQAAPNMGVGYIARYMSDGVTTYVPTVLAKVKFNQINSEAATQEEEIDWQTQELTAAIMRGDDSNHNWKYVGADYATEELAETALRTKLGLEDTEIYSVEQNLVNITSDYEGTSIEEGESLEINFTTTGTIGTVVVVMGGADVTTSAWDSSTNKITIASVTGNIVITAVAS